MARNQRHRQHPHRRRHAARAVPKGRRRWPLPSAQDGPTLREWPLDDDGFHFGVLAYDGQEGNTDSGGLGSLFPCSYTDALPTPGRTEEQEAAMQYNRARHYDPSPGRWLDEEPLD